MRAYDEFYIYLLPASAPHIQSKHVDLHLSVAEDCLRSLPLAFLFEYRNNAVIELSGYGIDTCSDCTK